MSATISPPQPHATAGLAPPPPVAMMQLITGAVWMTKAIYVAAKLGLADLVAEAPRTAAELAAVTGSHAPSLGRVLRALTSSGIFVEDESGRFQITPMAATLQTQMPGSLHAMAILWGEP